MFTCMDLFCPIIICHFVFHGFLIHNIYETVLSLFCLQVYMYLTNSSFRHLLVILMEDIIPMYNLYFS
jgi:hypothetical protein